MKNINPLSVAIMNLSNEVNIGGLIRTANSAALKEVIIIGRNRWNKGAATGAQFNTKVVKIRTSDEFIEHCQKNKYNIVSVEIGNDSKNIFDFEYPKNTVLVIGNGGKGIPENIIKNSFDCVYIPQFGDVECLNAAIAGSIAIYDWIRKNNIIEENKMNERKFGESGKKE